MANLNDTIIRGDLRVTGNVNGPFITGVTAGKGSNYDSVGTPSVSASLSNGILGVTFNYAKGPQGPCGPCGPCGPSGARGMTGPTGYGGARGPSGFTGPSGASGPCGPCGPCGPSGVCGPKGLPGSNGTWGTRYVTGVEDYWQTEGSITPSSTITTIEDWSQRNRIVDLQVFLTNTGTSAAYDTGITLYLYKGSTAVSTTAIYISPATTIMVPYIFNTGSSTFSTKIALLSGQTARSLQCGLKWTNYTY